MSNGNANKRLVWGEKEIKNLLKKKIELEAIHVALKIPLA